MFEIDRGSFDEMVEHGLAGFPNESCGLLAGKEGRAVKFFPMTNADASPVTYRLDPTEHLNFGGVSLRNAQLGRSVPCITLDDFVGLPRLKLVKIDVEGMEGDVLRGGLRLIAKFKPHLYIENDRVDQSEALMRLLDSLGYRLYWHAPALFEPDNYYQDEENIFPNIYSFNMLAVHREMPTAVSG